VSTHYHFLIETPHPNLSQAIQWINVGYSVNFNQIAGQLEADRELKRRVDRIRKKIVNILDATRLSNFFLQ
jgi:hypothetical protein